MFVGIDLGFMIEGPPLLFETMIFGGEHDQEQWRYSTWEEAEAGHMKALVIAKRLPWYKRIIPRRFLKGGSHD